MTPLQDMNDTDWLMALEEIGEERGYFERLGDHHSAILTDRARSLLVTFEHMSQIRQDSDDGLPFGFELSEENDWSHLCLMAHKPSWFRDADVYAYFDRLVDDGFFDEFDQVVFYGSGWCGYAAAAYSVVAPGATVIALRPQATLDPRVAGWDRRHTEMRRTCFTDRYGYAPDMIEAAEHAWIVYDPLDETDAMHAALFTRPNATKIRFNALGPRLEFNLNTLDVLPELIDLACKGELREADFARLYRRRHAYAPYLRNLRNHLQEIGRRDLELRVCRYGATKLNLSFFRKRQGRLERASDTSTDTPEAGARELAE